MDTKTKTYDRTTEDLGNLVHLEHVNILQPDQRPTTLFYVVALGGTRDPYVMVGLDNMWVNYGRTQMHMPSRDPQPQVLRGTIGFVVPDVDAVKARMKRVAAALAGTRFAWQDCGKTVEATCPWGNRVRCHPPAPEYGDGTQLGMVYIDYDAPAGSADGIARFYSEIMGAPAKLVSGSPGGAGKRAARVQVGRGQALYFSETDQPIPPYDGHHMEIYINDFSGPYRKLLERDLITMETDSHEWRFQKIVDPATGKLLFEVEHEIRSLKHPLYARPLVNRNPSQTNTAYLRGQDSFPGIY
jgi:hypothetical protein